MVPSQPIATSHISQLHHVASLDNLILSVEQVDLQQHNHVCELTQLPHHHDPSLVYAGDLHPDMDKEKFGQAGPGPAVSMSREYVGPSPGGSLGMPTSTSNSHLMVRKRERETHTHTHTQTTPPYCCMLARGIHSCKHLACLCSQQEAFLTYLVMCSRM